MSKSLNTFMEKWEDRLRFISPYKQEYEKFVDSLQDKQIVEAVFQKRRYAKTNEQLGYWYAVVMPCAVQGLLDAGYDTLFACTMGGCEVETNVETADLLFKTLFQRFKRAKDMPLKRDMTDDEMSELIEFTKRYCAENLNTIIPEPEK